ncbi:MAG: protein kinase, partial [Rickettsiales bacterium]|nr:protein kinase [Rickettsiales bacterium]
MDDEKEQKLENIMKESRLFSDLKREGSKVTADGKETLKIAKGGQGTVYRAHSGIIRRDVAIKVPHKKLDFEEGIGEYSYFKEFGNVPLGSALQSIEYASPDGAVIAEYQTGGALSSLSKKDPERAKEICLDPKKLSRLFNSIRALNEKGWVHRDIKEDNIFLDKNNDFVLGDFGVAQNELTNKRDGTAPIGTLGYIPPELLKLGDNSEKDLRKQDVFAMGITLFQVHANTDMYELLGVSQQASIFHIIFRYGEEPG